MKDKEPKVFKSVKTSSTLDFLKINISFATASKGIILNKIQGIVF